MADPEDILFVRHAGWTTAFSPGELPTASRFGGPLESSLFGTRFGPRKLHQIAFIAFADLRTPVLKSFPGLPLLYGMCFDGCDLKYRVSERDVDIERITPDRSSEDWPYERYPNELPLVPLVPVRTWQQEWTDFMPYLNEWESSDLTVIVPPPARLGFSLWGSSGDAEGVVLVFQYSLANNAVRAFNVCG